MAEQQALEVARWFLGLFFPGVAAFYIIRLTTRRRELGHSAVSHGIIGSRQWWIAKTFVVFRMAITLAMLGRVVWPGFDVYLLACSFLMTPAVVLTGLAFLICGFATVIALHFGMGATWRSGLPAGGAVPPLITTGPFAWTRNPMFLAIQLAQLGLLLAFPSGFTVVCLLVGVTMLHLQVRLEETHLLAAHGQAYRDYCDRTARWITFRRLPYFAKAGNAAAQKIVGH